MRPASSLRKTLLLGLLALQVVILGGMSATVYLYAKSVAHEALERDLAIRARTLSGMVELEGGEPELEVSAKANPEYVTRESGVYAEFFGPGGRAFKHSVSPSLGAGTLKPVAPFELGTLSFDELEEGPDGFPCAAATFSFLLGRDQPDANGDDEDDGETAAADTPDAERCYQVRVAMDSRPRDESLAGLAWFLLAASTTALVLTWGGGWFVAARVLRPVSAMTEEATELTAADPSRRLQPSGVVRELRVLAETINGAFDRLAGALSRQRRFTADASHELRTPIAVLLSNSELMLRRKRPAEQYVEGLALQRRVALRMRDMVENLLSLARSDAGDAALAVASVRVQDLVDDVARDFDALAEGSGVSLQFTVEPGLAVACDRAAVTRLLGNLVSNALKYTPGGGRVGLECGGDGNDVILTVWDTGTGIAEEERERVFERFYRVRGDEGTVEGAGLGLAIVKDIADAHGGSVSLTAHPSGGARFVVRLPRRVLDRSRDEAAVRL